MVVSVPGGALSGTWTPDAADEYRISADVSIPKGSTLTLQPGTHVIVDAGVTMTVNGTLSVAGSSAAPVTLGSSSARPKSGDWQGLLIGDGAALSMRHTVLSDTAQAISTTVRRTAGVVVSDSSVLRSSGGLLIRAGALTLERSTIDGGVSVRRGDGPAASSDAITIDDDTVSTGPIDVVSRNTSPAAVPVVVRDDVVTGVGSPRLIPTTTTVVTTYPIEIEDDELRPSDVVGNRMSQNELNGIALGGVLVENWTIPTGGPQYVVWAESAAGGRLEVQSGVTLTVPAGATLKVSDGTTLEVLGDLQVIGTASKEAVITVAEDDTAGSTVGYFGPPAAGAWAGLVPHFGGTLELRFARIDYATTTVDAYRSSVTIVDSQLLHARWPSRFDQGSLTLHRSTVDGGVTAHRPASSVLPDAQIDIEDDLITDGPLTVLSENAEPQSAPIVVERNVVQNVVAPAWAMPTYPIQIWDEALRPSHLTGNTLSGAGQPAFAIGGTLIEDWTPPADAWHYVLSAAYWPFQDVGDATNPTTAPDTALRIAAGTTLDLPAGSILKVERDTSSDDVEHVFVDGALATDGTPDDPAIMTTVTDDSEGGDLNGDGTASQPNPGEWSGLVVGIDGIVPASGLDVLYGQ